MAVYWSYISEGILRKLAFNCERSNTHKEYTTMRDKVITPEVVMATHRSRRTLSNPLRSMHTNDSDTNYPITLVTESGPCWYHSHTVNIMDVVNCMPQRLTRTVLEEDCIDERCHSWLHDGREGMIHLPHTSRTSLPSQPQSKHWTFNRNDAHATLPQAYSRHQCCQRTAQNTSDYNNFYHYSFHHFITNQGLHAIQTQTPTIDALKHRTV